MAKRTPLFAANWKMNKTLAEVAPYVEKLSSLATGIGYEVVIGPPATHLALLIENLKKTSFKAAAQNCGTAKSGAFTGELSPVVLKEMGCDSVILGHSERRHIYKEDDALVGARLKACWEAGLTGILCVGEKLEERKAGKTMSVVETQLSVLKGGAANFGKLVVAYEPVWAIGTGENATPEQAEEVHKAIRQWVSSQIGSGPAESLRILYGGSVKPDNAKVLLAQPNLDGFLIGGASLEANSFAEVIKKGLESRL